MNIKGKRLTLVLTALSVALSILAPVGAATDARPLVRQLVGYLHSCPLVMTEASFEQTALLGKVRDTMKRLEGTLNTEQNTGRLTVAQADELRTELEIVGTNMEDAIADGKLTYDEAHFVVRRLAQLDNRSDMLISSHPATRIAIDTDIDIRLRDLNGRLAEDVSAGLLTASESDELRRSLAIVAVENSKVEADRVITRAEQERMKIAMDIVGNRLDELTTNSYVTVRSLFTWSDFEPRQQQLLNRINTAVDQGRLSAPRAAVLRTNLEQVRQVASSINANRSGQIVAAQDLIILRQKQNMIDRRITEEIRIAARQRPSWH
ncbi:MAG: hypothetical protein K2W95_11275 [Candidatus Obscuribacterales bacterium]|nr:hypothetical protein [Candidatus Obscuribacterales bacterium]